MSSTPRKRVIIAGIDGATWDIINPMIEAGKLPNLAAMVKNGCCGPLTSTVPPNSSLAWTSFMTGVHPGKHGVFFFREQRHGSYQRPVVSMNSVQVPSVFRLASEAGKKVASITVPLTFPVEKVNGCMIGGLLTPDRHSDFIHPPELRKELEEAIGDVPADNEPEMLFHSASEGAAVKSMFHVIEQITRMGEHVLDNHDPDFFVLVFRQVDLTSHQAWCYQDPQWQKANPGKWETRKDLLADVYIAVDAAFGRIRDRALKMDGDAVFGTCSDHGFGRITYRYYMNKWLLDNGYLVLKSSAESMKRKLWMQKKWNGALRRSGILKILTERGRKLGKGQEHTIMEMIDWSKTRAYSSFSGGEDIVLINVKGREPEGIVDPGSEYEALREEIIAKVVQMKAPDGAKIIARAFKREDLWEGEQLHIAPDIQCVTKETACNMSPSPLHSVVAEPAVEGRPAMHRTQGIYGWEGKGVIKEGERVTGPQIADMATTMLHLLGLPVEDYMDGRVMEDCFTPEYRAANPVQTREGFVNLAPREMGEALEEDDEKLIETMKALGYME
ncbi:MAG: alkaline phosphatase family protein [Planctomycetota bacterium]|nr:alkaline phosphatase family protein [Planctomycetota bacterium]MDA1113506.1 alkaline phosphatase family protein [Planctomycetota bacterium]